MASCNCGSVFMADAAFCRKCGAKRPANLVFEKARTRHVSSFSPPPSNRVDLVKSKAAFEPGKSTEASDNEKPKPYEKVDVLSNLHRTRDLTAEIVLQINGVFRDNFPDIPCNDLDTLGPLLDVGGGCLPPSEVLSRLSRAEQLGVQRERFQSVKDTLLSHVGADEVPVASTRDLAAAAATWAEGLGGKPAKSFSRQPARFKERRSEFLSGQKRVLFDEAVFGDDDADPTDDFGATDGRISATFGGGKDDDSDNDSGLGDLTHHSHEEKEEEFDCIKSRARVTELMLRFRNADEFSIMAGLHQDIQTRSAGHAEDLRFVEELEAERNTEALLFENAIPAIRQDVDDAEMNTLDKLNTFNIKLIEISKKQRERALARAKFANRKQGYFFDPSQHKVIRGRGSRAASELTDAAEGLDLVHETEEAAPGQTGAGQMLQVISDQRNDIATKQTEVELFEQKLNLHQEVLEYLESSGKEGEAGLASEHLGGASSVARAAPPEGIQDVLLEVGQAGAGGGFARQLCFEPAAAEAGGQAPEDSEKLLHEEVEMLRKTMQDFQSSMRLLAEKKQAAMRQSKASPMKPPIASVAATTSGAQVRDRIGSEVSGTTPRSKLTAGSLSLAAAAATRSSGIGFDMEDDKLVQVQRQKEQELSDLEAGLSEQEAFWKNATRVVSQMQEESRRFYDSVKEMQELEDRFESEDLQQRNKAQRAIAKAEAFQSQASAPSDSDDTDAFPKMRSRTTTSNAVFVGDEAGAPHMSLPSSQALARGSIGDDPFSSPKKDHHSRKEEVEELVKLRVDDNLSEKEAEEKLAKLRVEKEQAAPDSTERERLERELALNVATQLRQTAQAAMKAKKLEYDHLANQLKGTAPKDLVAGTKLLEKLDSEVQKLTTAFSQLLMKMADAERRQASLAREEFAADRSPGFVAPKDTQADMTTRGPPGAGALKSSQALASVSSGTNMQQRTSQSPTPSLPSPKAVAVAPDPPRATVKDSGSSGGNSSSGQALHLASPGNASNMAPSSEGFSRGTMERAISPATADSSSLLRVPDISLDVERVATPRKAMVGKVRLGSATAAIRRKDGDVTLAERKDAVAELAFGTLHAPENEHDEALDTFGEADWQSPSSITSMQRSSISDSTRRLLKMDDQQAQDMAQVLTLKHENMEICMQIEQVEEKTKSMKRSGTQLLNIVELLDGLKSPESMHNSEEFFAIQTLKATVRRLQNRLKKRRQSWENPDNLGQVLQQFSKGSHAGFDQRVVGSSISKLREQPLETTPIGKMLDKRRTSLALFVPELNLDKTHDRNLAHLRKSGRRESTQHHLFELRASARLFRREFTSVSVAACVLGASPRETLSDGEQPTQRQRSQPVCTQWRGVLPARGAGTQRQSAMWETAMLSRSMSNLNGHLLNVCMDDGALLVQGRRQSQIQQQPGPSKRQLITRGSPAAEKMQSFVDPHSDIMLHGGSLPAKRATNITPYQTFSKVRKGLVSVPARTSQEVSFLD